jgi:predicted MFS family arabinose efflux permease
VLGLPLATFLAQWAGWRGAFWAVAGLVLVAGVAVLVTVRRPVAGRVGAAAGAGAGSGAGSGADSRVATAATAATAGTAGTATTPTTATTAGGLRAELALFRNRRLWAVYGTSMLHIGALFAAFSFFAAIFIDVTGFAPGLVPVVLTGYGAAAVIGNMVVGRLADRYPMAVLTLGLTALVVLLAGFAAGAAVPAVVLVTVIGLGLVGLPLNSATIARRMRVVANTPMINTVGASVVNVGIAVGPTLGGLAISAGLGLTAPLWIGATLAGLAVLSLLPYLRPATDRTPTPTAPSHDSRGREPQGSRRPRCRLLNPREWRVVPGHSPLTTYLGTSETCAATIRQPSANRTQV